MPLAVIDAGLAYQRRTLADFASADLFSERFALRDLNQADLSSQAALLIPCRTPGHRLARHKDFLADYVRQGGLLVVMGETNPDLFLEDLAFTPEPTNFWWWREPGMDLGVHIDSQSHPILADVRQQDCAWHVHGTLSVPEGGQVLLSWHPAPAVSPTGGAGALMVDYPLGEGRVIVTSLDPIYHHGSGFMPATTRFLMRFLPNVRAYAAAHRNMLTLNSRN